MDFLSEEHKQKIREIEQLWARLKDLQAEAHQYGIEDIFQDNGAKILQQLIYLNFRNLPGREGNDALDNNGTEWEMKSINLATSATGFSTNHHTTHEIIAKYKQVPWAFAIYSGIELQEMYVMTPAQLAPIFSHWETQLQGRSHLNNPKISVSFVRENGTKVFPIDYDNPIDPSTIN